MAMRSDSLRIFNDLSIKSTQIKHQLCRGSKRVGCFTVAELFHCLAGALAFVDLAFVYHLHLRKPAELVENILIVLRRGRPYAADPPFSLLRG